MAEVGAHPGAHRTWSEHFSMYLPIFLIMSSVFFTELKALICGMISSGKWNLNSNGRETIFFFFLFQQFHIGKERTHSHGGCKALNIIRAGMGSPEEAHPNIYFTEEQGLS